MGECFITRRGGASAPSYPTPESLGYISDAILFYDAQYNGVVKHVNNGSYWVDLVSSNPMVRKNYPTSSSSSSLITDNYYIKENKSDSALILPDKMQYDNFTIELLFKIINASNSENDILANFSNSGFGIYTNSSGKLKAAIYTGDYEGITYEAYSFDTFYSAVISYDGEIFSFFINGSLVGQESVNLNSYKKPQGLTMLGSNSSYDYYQGSYQYYRCGVYKRALSTEEITQNYNKDFERYISI